jgi:hypothetical protein
MNTLLMLMLFAGAFLFILGGLLNGHSREETVYMPVKVPQTRNSGSGIGGLLLFVLVMVVLINFVA